jgi:hypothetical protein
MNIPILLGRTFYPREKNAVIVSQSFARQQWPNQNPIGQRLGDNDSTKSIVVGVAGNAHINALSDDDATEQYWSAKPDDMPDMVVLARTAGAPDNLLPISKSISESLDPKVFPEIRRLKILYHDNISGIEKTAMAVSLIGMIAVLVSGIGIIGLVTFTVSQRMKEIAIRIALGGNAHRCFQPCCVNSHGLSCSAWSPAQASLQSRRRCCALPCTESTTSTHSAMQARSSYSLPSSPSPRCCPRGTRCG